MIVSNLLTYDRLLVLPVELIVYNINSFGRYRRVFVCLFVFVFVSVFAFVFCLAVGGYLREIIIIIILACVDESPPNSTLTHNRPLN